MTITDIKVKQAAGQTVVEATMVTDNLDEAVARALFERVRIAQLVEAAVVEYSERASADIPYEDAGSVDDLRRIARP